MYAGCIVETRQIPLRNIVRRHMEFLPKDWELVVFTGEKDAFAKAELVGFNARFIKIHVEHLTASLYNKLLTSLDFWNVLNYDRVLIFQHDSGLLREGIDEFLEYDFIGAPLKHIKYPALNGGLSLRNPKKMIEVIQKLKYNETIHGNEDMYFCNHMKVAPIEAARKFSCETIYQLGTLGYHAIEKWLTKEQIINIKNQKKCTYSSMTKSTFKSLYVAKAFSRQRTSTPIQGKR